MSYRPITDVWILARPKVKYYGAYPNGFLERALPMIGATENDRVLHLCGGRAKLYPNRRLVAHAATVDVDPETQPDWVADLSRDRWAPEVAPLALIDTAWHAVLIDPPYTDADHAKYSTGGASMPSPSRLLRIGLDLVKPGGKVGVLHYVWPRPPEDARSIACIGVVCGFGNRMRCFSVFERKVSKAAGGSA